MKKLFLLLGILPCFIFGQDFCNNDITESKIINIVDSSSNLKKRVYTEVYQIWSYKDDGDSTVYFISIKNNPSKKNNDGLMNKVLNISVILSEAKLRVNVPSFITDEYSENYEELIDDFGNKLLLLRNPDATSFVLFYTDKRNKKPTFNYETLKRRLKYME